MKEHKNYDRADFNAMRNSGLMQSLVGERTRFDSADDASVFFARELDFIKSKSYDKKYPELTALQIFPKSSEVDEGADTITYYSYDRTGFAKVIDNYSTDLPVSDVTGSPHTARIAGVGNSYIYSIQEMRASRMAGKNLDSRKAENARYQIERTINKIAWAGDADTGLMGVLSEGQQIPTMTIAAGAETTKTNWKEKNADEILADISAMQTSVAKMTKNVERPDTLVLPSDIFIELSTRRIPDSDETVMSFVKKHSPYIKEIIPAAELNSDSVETNPYANSQPEQGKGVALLFTNDPDKLSIENPIPFNQLPVQPQNLGFKVACEARTAGVIVYYPMSALIAIGV